MDRIEFQLQPGSVPEWEAEDILAGRLADDTQLANEAEAKKMLDELTFVLPRDILQVELQDYNAKQPTPLALEIPPNSSVFDYFLIQLPLNILVPEGANLVRLRVHLDLNGDTRDRPLVAYDLFPVDHWEEKTTSIGAVDLDISKALTFLFPAPIAAVGQCLGLKLSFPLQWKSQYMRIRTTDRMSNPVQWEVSDQSILNGFTAYAVIRVPKGSQASIAASLAGELRKSELGGLIRKTRFLSDKKAYALTKQ